MNKNNGTQTHLSQQAFNHTVREVAEYIHIEDWDRASSLSALVPTVALVDVSADELIDSALLTVATQEPLSRGIEGGSSELADSITRTS